MFIAMFFILNINANVGFLIELLVCFYVQSLIVELLLLLSLAIDVTLFNFEFITWVKASYVNVI